MAKIKPFEEHADEYEAWFDENKFVYESELSAIQKLLPSIGTGIEIGVGSGRFAAPLGIKLGIEPSEKMREIAKKRGINVIDGIAENLPFDDNKYDFALMVTTVCFLDDINSAFKEIYRILKSNGKIIIGFIDKESFLGKLYLKNKKNNPFYKIAKFYSTSEVVCFLKNCEFKNFSYTQTIFKDLNKIKEKEIVKDGFGEGAFIVISAFK